jgi:hypothetical protein
MPRILLTLFSVVCAIVAIARCFVLPTTDGLGVTTLYFVLASGALLLLQQVEKLKFLDWEVTLRKATEVAEEAMRKTDALNEVLPVAINAHTEKPKNVARPSNRQKNPQHPDDAQKGRWGGKPRDKDRELFVETIKPLTGDPDNYSIPLGVRSTNPAGRQLGPGKVRFHIHNSFVPDIIEADVIDGVARITLVAYGAFTVGAETCDSPPVVLELDLAAPEVDAPKKFKDL